MAGTTQRYPMDRAQAVRLAKLMQGEIARAATMRIGRHPRPYFVSHLVRHDESWRIEAKYGALTQDQHEVRRSCLCDVRVGSYRHDQVDAGGLKDNSTEVESYDMLQLPHAGHADGVRHALWRLTEARYREAIDDLLHKQAIELSYVNEHKGLPSFERLEAGQDLRFAPLPALDREAMRDFAVKASSVYRKLPLVRDSAVRIHATNAMRLFASSEGTLRLQCLPYRTVELYTWYLSAEGYSVPYTRTWFCTDPAELPDLPTVEREARRIHRRLAALAAAPLLRSFVGPVLLDPRPAGLLIHEALGHRLEGNRLLSTGEGQTFADSKNSPVLPEGLTVYDDPRITHYEGRSLVGHYRFDDEGVDAQRADLIDDGTLRGFLTSRTPIDKQHHSNGHGRSAHHARAISRMGVTMVEASDGLDDDELRAAFLQEIRDQEVPYGIRIMEAYGGETSTESYDFQAFLGDIDFAARVYPDGREELVRGVDFVGTPLNAMGGILAAGKRREVDNSFCGAESGELPVSTVSPALLFDELELQSKPSRPLSQYAYPMPWENNGKSKR